MKLIFISLLIFCCLKGSTAHKKLRKHSTNIDPDGSPIKLVQFYNQTEQKLFTQLLHNFNENEQMSEIISIFKNLKTQVKNSDEKLSTSAEKVLGINKEIINYYSMNKFDLGDSNKTRVEFNNNVLALKKAKSYLIEILKDLQVNKLNFTNYTIQRNDSILFNNETNIGSDKNESVESNQSKIIEPFDKYLNESIKKEVKYESTIIIPNYANHNLNEQLKTEKNANNKSIEIKINISNENNKSIDLNQTKDNSMINFTEKTKDIDSLLEFDSLFSLIKDIHRSHKLKPNDKKKSHNLTEIQKKTDYHLKILSNGSDSNITTVNTSNTSILNSSRVINKSIEETFEDVASIKSNLKSVLESVELESNMMYNLNQKNKLKKMNLENYIIEQIGFLKKTIKDLKKTRFWINNFENAQNESKRALLNFEKLANSTTFQVQQMTSFKELDTVNNKMFNSLNSKTEFY